MDDHNTTRLVLLVFPDVVSKKLSNGFGKLGDTLEGLDQEDKDALLLGTTTFSF
ncbi:hypothetical protein BDFB_014756 [Asbolus verrucosus]|uniref:Uncharacterized protein n=1 Tax=Asbolus verrucosus TaxID=1661398 RepID=A0A482W8G0_ASBVE|nr:hypothetical protein BDFB_014756 [Asbolus verrucosus]